MINCEKFLFYGYENKQECLLANKPIPTTSESFMTGLTYQPTMATSQLITSTVAESDTSNALIKPLIIILITIIALFGFLGLALCIVKRLIIRTIVRRFADAIQTKFKASKLAGIWNDAKAEINAKDLNFIANLREKKFGKKSDLESQTETIITVSYDE